MASPQELKHRPTQDKSDQVQEQKNRTEPTSDKNAGRKKKAGRGARTLIIAVALPLSLSLFDVVLFGSSNRHRKVHKPFYFPPLWALNLGCLSSAMLAGFSAWLIWAEGGFHRQPTALILYLAQFVLGLFWYPIVFWAGAIRIGLVLCAGLFAVMVGCSIVFKRLNAMAGDLVKPCLVWALLLAVTNVRLVSG